LNNVKIIDIVPKQIWANIELSEVAIKGILDFFEKSVLLYNKVYFDVTIDESLNVTNEFISQLKSIKKAIDEEKI